MIKRWLFVAAALAVAACSATATGPSSLRNLADSAHVQPK